MPGDSRVAAEIDVTRAVARRAERELALVSVKFGSDTGAKKYMNRLSDYFYVLARYVDVAKIGEKRKKLQELLKIMRMLQQVQQNHRQSRYSRIH